MYLGFYGSCFECSWFVEEYFLCIMLGSVTDFMKMGSFAGRAKTVPPLDSTFLLLFVFHPSPDRHWLWL